MRKQIKLLFFLIGLICIFLPVCAASEVDSTSFYTDSINRFSSKEKKLAYIRSLLADRIRPTKEAGITMELGQIGLELATSMHDDDQISYFNRLLASTYGYIGDYEKQMSFSQQNLELNESRQDTNEIIMDLYNMASIPFKIGHYEKALSYYTRALKLALVIDCHYIYYIYSGISKTHLELKQFREAEKYINHCPKTARESGKQAGIAVSYLNLSSLYKEEQKYQSAMKYANLSLDMWEGSENYHALSRVHNHLASLYLLNNDAEKAIENATKGKEMAEQGNFPNLLSNSLEILANAYEKIQNYEKAFHYNKLLLQTNDELLNEERLKQIHLLETNFEIRQKEHELTLLNEKSKIEQLEIQKSNYLNYLLAMLMLTLLISAFFITRHYKSKMREENIKLERKLLRAQMNPHFIFNSLIAIQNYIFKSKTEKAAHFLSKYAELMRLILENSRQEYISLETEIKTVTRYLELQKLRFGNMFEYEIDVQADIPKYNTLVPPMLMQPFLENALEHGLNNYRNGGLITVSIHKKNEHLILEMKDNGIGREHAKAAQRNMVRKYQSLATKITKERLEVLNKPRKQKIRLDIIDLKTPDGNALGTNVVFTIPIRYGFINKAV